MAKGASDWVARTDILLQTLAEVITRYKYGGFNSVRYYDYIPASVLTTVITVSGRGLILGGFYDTYGTTIQRDDYVTVNVDGSFSQGETYLDMALEGRLVPVRGIPFLSAFDEVNFIYAAGWNVDVTFESSFQVGYAEEHGNTPEVEVVITYAII